MARHDCISPDCEAEIERLLLAGAATEAVSRKLGISISSVQIRRRKLVRARADFAKCACGKGNGHRGVCSFRFKRNTALPDRPRGMALPRINKHPTYDTHRRRAKLVALPQTDNPADLMRFVEMIVPLSYPHDIREDVRQDMLVDLLCGSLHAVDAATKLPVYVRKAFELSPKGPDAPLDIYTALDSNGEALHEALIDERQRSALDYLDEPDEEYISGTEAYRRYLRAGFTA